MTPYTPQAGDYVVAAELTDDQLQAFADAVIRAGACRISTIAKAKKRGLYGWDQRDNTLFASDLTTVGSEVLFTHNVTHRFKETPMSHRLGDYVYCPDLTDEQIERFVDACRPYIDDVEGDHMEFVRGGYPYLAIDRDNDLWTFSEKRPFMTNNVTDQYKGDTPMTIRNPFQKGDRVVPNGFKYFGDRMRHGSNSTMEEWEANQTVLKVISSSSFSLRAGIDPNHYNYHYSEVRMATDKEVQAAEQPEKPSVELKNGSLIKLEGTVYMVTRASFDSEYRVRAISVDSGTVRLITVHGPDAETLTVLGQIMPDGDFRPAEAASTSTIDQDPRTWKPGDKIRCGTDISSYLTKGRVYEIEDIDHADGTMTIKCEDDGEPGRRSLDSYHWVKVA